MTDNETLGTFLIALGTLIKNKSTGGLVDDSMMGLAKMAMKEEEAVSLGEVVIETPQEVTDTGVSLQNIETAPIEVPHTDFIKPNMTGETEYTRRIQELETRLQQRGLNI